MNVAIYTRVSTLTQAEEGFSLEAQYEKLVEHINYKGWNLVGVYSDPGESGGNINRPGVQNMIKDMKRKIFDAVLIHKLDRLTRNLGDLHDLIQLFNNLDVRLIVLGQDIDTKSAMGKAFVYMSGIFAEIYLDNLREEVLKGMTKRAEKGLRNGSVVPLGYQENENGVLVPDEEEAQHVRTMFELYARGYGVVKIQEHMMKLNVTGKKNGILQKDTIFYILKNQTYLGTTHWKGIAVENTHPPIIERELWDKVQKMLERKSKKTRSRSSFDYPFSSILKCGRCGNSMNGHATKKKSASGGDLVYYSYHCHGKHHLRQCDMPDLSELKMDRLFLDQLLPKVRVSMDQADIYEPDTDEEVKKQQRMKRRLERQIADSKKILDNWAYAMGRGSMDINQYVRLRDEEQAKIAEWEDELSRMGQPQPARLSPEEMNQWINAVIEIWDRMERLERKDVVQTMFDRIEVHHNGLVWNVGEWSFAD